MKYNRINWTNSVTTPVNATNLNNMDKGIDDAKNEINNAKAEIDEVNTTINDMKNNQVTGSLQQQLDLVNIKADCSCSDIDIPNTANFCFVVDYGRHLFFGYPSNTANLPSDIAGSSDVFRIEVWVRSLGGDFRVQELVALDINRDQVSKYIRTFSRAELHYQPWKKLTN